MRYLMVLSLLLSGCVHKPMEPRTGAIIPGHLQQDTEQCAVQPQLPWCPHAK